MKCEICGCEIEMSYFSGANLCGDVKCHNKHIWNETLDGNEVIIDGKCYHIGDENSTSSFRGFGGGKFHIIFNDGREVYTTNLWANGSVPKEYNRKDNARFDWEFLKEEYSFLKK